MIKFEDLKQDFSFIFETEDDKNDIYFCNCGHVSEQKEKEEAYDKDQVGYLYPEKANSDEDDDLGFGEIYKNIKMGLSDEKIPCPGCNKNFASLENQKSLISTNYFFVSDFEIIDDEEDLTLICSKFKVDVDVNNDAEKLLEKFKTKLVEESKYLRLNKKTKKFFYKAFDEDEIEFDLDKVNFYSAKMFKEETKIIYNIYNLQIYIGLLAKHVIDVNNTNVVTELLEEIRGISNYAGLDVIQKIVSIFLGIIKYNNLSTIALTKGCKFLYDLMVECDIPNSKVMRESEATSPIKIFNFLVGNYITKINEEVNEDNKKSHEFTYKSSKAITMEVDEGDEMQEAKKFDVVNLDEEKEMTIEYSTNKNYKSKVKNDDESGDYEVMTITKDANASKFIYKRLRNFHDFKQILKYFKFYNKHEVINLLQKYDLDFLVEVIELIYFRDKAPIKEFYKILDIIKDFVKTKTLEIKPTLDESKLELQYILVRDFEFTYYDDSVMMMEVLDFDPKREFNKIKTYIELIKYHDNLVKYFNVVSDKDKCKKFTSFVERFRFLESKVDYDGPLEIKLIDNPAMLIAEGVQMRHSASSYSKKVINNIYLIGQIFDRSENLPGDEVIRFTVGFSFHKTSGIEFHQVKGPENKPGTDRFKRLLMDYLEAKDISYRPLKDLKLTS